MDSSLLISSEYRTLLETDHALNPSWGTTGARYVPHIRDMMRRYNVHTILDYGSGKGRLADKLGVPVTQYDPGIPEHAGLPQPHDLVITTDVLEHIEPDKIQGVLEHIRSLTKVVGFHAIAMGKAAHKLPDGRNAHLLLRSTRWWDQALSNCWFKVNPVRLSVNKPRFEEVMYTVEVLPE